MKKRDLRIFVAFCKFIKCQIYSSKQANVPLFQSEDLKDWVAITSHLIFLGFVSGFFRENVVNSLWTEDIIAGMWCRVPVWFPSILVRASSRYFSFKSVFDSKFWPERIYEYIDPSTIVECAVGLHFSSGSTVGNSPRT